MQLFVSISNEKRDIQGGWDSCSSFVMGIYLCLLALSFAYICTAGEIITCLAGDESEG